MAEIAHVDYITGSQIVTGGAYNYAAGQMGIPSILLERGSNSVWSRDEVEEDKHDVINILRFLGILEGKPHCQAKRPVSVDPVIYKNAEHSGCWYPVRQPGETFRKGEILGKSVTTLEMCWKYALLNRTESFCMKQSVFAYRKVHRW